MVCWLVFVTGFISFVLVCVIALEISMEGAVRIYDHLGSSSPLTDRLRFPTPYEQVQEVVCGAAELAGTYFCLLEGELGV